MKYGEFKKELERIYNEKFKDSQCVVESSTFYKSIWITLFLSKNQSECANNIRMNDIFHIQFRIATVNGEFESIIENDTELDGVDLVLENTNNCYMTKPDNQYCVYGSKSVTFRKTKGDTSKILKSFEKYVTRLYDSLVADLENDIIHSSHIDMVKSKI